MNKSKSSFRYLRVYLPQPLGLISLRNVFQIQKRGWETKRLSRGFDRFKTLAGQRRKAGLPRKGWGLNPWNPYPTSLEYNVMYGWVSSTTTWKHLSFLCPGVYAREMSICVYMNNWTRMFMAALFTTFPKLEILHRYINEEDNKKKSVTYSNSRRLWRVKIRASNPDESANNVIKESQNRKVPLMEDEDGCSEGHGEEGLKSDDSTVLFKEHRCTCICYVLYMNARDVLCLQ